MITKALKPSLSVAAMLLIPTLASAHTGVGETSGLLHGFEHPVSGIDHVLAMVMVGVFAWRLGGRALSLTPLTFVLIMAAGGALGVFGVAIPFVEVGIALSVVVFGTIVALNVKASTAAAMGIVGLFAIFHGHAHGAEMPENTGGIAYAAGFVLATALLHLTGIGTSFLADIMGERNGLIIARSAGGLAALAGVGLLTGTI